MIGMIVKQTVRQNHMRIETADNTDNLRTVFQRRRQPAIMIVKHLVFCKTGNLR